MKKLSIGTLALLLGGGLALATSPVDTSGALNVSDKAGVFTEAGIKKAKEAFHDTTFHARTHLSVFTVKGVPDTKKDEYARIAKIGDVKERNEAGHRFMNEWARELAKDRNEVGTAVLILNDNGSFRYGGVSDRATDVHRKLDDKDMSALVDKFRRGFKDTKGVDDAARQAHDAVLLDAATFTIDQLKDTTLPATKEAAKKKEGTGMSGIWGYVCIGAVVLLGIWLVVGIFRALANRGGGGGGGYGGGGYGGGGGGGGFMSGMLGGLFGGMAGMWMYNNMFGGSHASDMSAGGATGGDYGSAATDTGEGDFNGGSEATGGDDWGDTGGADTGGGGGDWGDSGGGGGDFGGGGGDLGGGGGDW